MEVYLASSHNDKSEIVFSGISCALNKFGFTTVPKPKPGLMDTFFGSSQPNPREIAVGIYNVEMTSPVRTTPASMKETISGSKLRAYSLYEKYKGNWCIGIETGMMKSGHYYDPTETTETTAYGEFTQNPHIGEYMQDHNCSTEKQYQMILNNDCRQKAMNLGIKDLSSSDNYISSAVTVISPEGVSITFLSEASPLSYEDRQMELHKCLHREIASNGCDDYTFMMSNGVLDTNTSLTIPISCAFGKLIKIKQKVFGSEVKKFWTHERSERMEQHVQNAYPPPHSPYTFPQFQTMSTEEIVKNTPGRYWMHL